jgi:alpha-beta hydrolase superfamily lysophospholipase
MKSISKFVSSDAKKSPLYLTVIEGSSYSNSESSYHFIFQHGLLEHQGNHLEFLDNLSQEFPDSVIFAQDLLGHGRSGGARCHVDTFDVYLKDFQNLLKYASDYSSHGKNFIISHSLGGLISLLSLLEVGYQKPLKIGGCIFTNPALSSPLKIPSKFAQRSTLALLKNIQIPTLYGAADLTQDKKKIKSYTLDPLISKTITLGLGIEILKAMRLLKEQSYFFDIPSLFLLSGRDDIVDNSKTRLFQAGMSHGKALVREFPDGRHDLLNEVMRKDVYKEIFEYIRLKG